LRHDARGGHDRRALDTARHLLIGDLGQRASPLFVNMAADRSGLVVCLTLSVVEGG
jgi:hypothetical protein